MFTTPSPLSVRCTPLRLLVGLCTLIQAATFTSFAGGLNAPDFGPKVLVFSPEDPQLQAKVDALFKEQESAQFGSGRYAILLKPGSYSLDLKVGFYTQVSGLGQTPDAVSVQGSVRASAAWMNYNATCNFWRGVENLSVTPTRDEGTMVWSVSQGTYLRRLHVRGALAFSEKGWSSGGFMADSVIDKGIDTGTQQQWFARNSRWQSWTGAGGGWNMVWVGCPDGAQVAWPKPPYTHIPQTPLSRERPFLALDAQGEFQVIVPDFNPHPSSGASWQNPKASSRSLPLSTFHIAQPGRDTTATLNAALAAGKNLLLCPGIYDLDESLRVDRKDTLVMGLGYATLIPRSGRSAIEVNADEGVILAGLMIDAGPQVSKTLVRVGRAGVHAGNAQNPTVLFDLFCRVGGALVGRADHMLDIHSDHVVGDNLWLWRADHGAGADWNQNTNKVGLQVEGDQVTVYGLMVEHTQEYQTLWKGEKGRVYFYQSEMPYDPPSVEAWSHDGVTGYASYKVADEVKEHEAWGLGVYCVFFKAPLLAENALEAPAGPGIKLRHLLTLRLNGQKGSGIKHILSGKGDPAVESHRHATMK